ncbi:MAG: outer membrane protein transport protein [Bacteroidaceae bacterium]|nr:outer membrane protein transport protein [Bacteroidaceae bacterium]
MKRLFTSIAFASLAAVTFAGGLLTNTNQSASFVRNPARYASLSTDAIYFNPAGTAFFNEGWSFSANWQMIWQQRDAIDKTMGQNVKYDGKVYVPCMPTLFAAYKTGDWTFSGFFGMPGGGGKAEFNNGLPSFYYMAQNLFKQGFNTQTGGYGTINEITAGSQFESTQYLFALQLGAAYKITENLSAYAGVRANYVTNNYNGRIYGNINGTIPYIPEGATAPQMITKDFPQEYNVDLDQSGIAFAPIVGVDYKIGNFNFAAKYEFRAVTTVENELNEGADIAAAALPEFADGNTLRADAPAILSLAGSWQIIPRLQVMAGWNYYFDKDAKVESLMGGDNMKKLSRNTIEYTFGAEFKLTEKLLLSAGIQYSNYGINDAYTSDLAFVNDCFMTGLGGKYSLTDKVDINFGYCYANYAPDYDIISIAPELSTRYERKTHNATIGVDFRL